MLKFTDFMAGDRLLRALQIRLLFSAGYLRTLLIIFVFFISDFVFSVFYKFKEILRVSLFEPIS